MPKISQFPAGGAAQNTDLIPIVRNGGDYTVTGYNLASLASYGQAYVGTFTATAGQTVFTLPASPGSLANLFISVDGAVMVPGSDYTWTTPVTLTFAVGLKVGQTVLYNYTTSVPIGTSLAGGVSGQVQYNNSGVLNGTTIGGDATLVATTGALTVTKTAGVAFAASATTDTTNAANISSGILPVARQSYTQGGTGSVARTVTNKLQESVSVKDFGAVGDGTTDDTAAIQAAINSIPISGGGSTYGYTLFFPSGKYLISSTLTIGNRRLKIQGSTLATGSGSASIIYCTSNISTMIDASTGNADVFSIQGIEFIGAGISTVNAITLGSVGQTIYDSRINNCWFSIIGGTAIVGNYIADVEITDCGFDSGNKIGIKLNNPSTYDSTGVCTISNNIFYGQSQAGIYIAYSTNNIITGNIFELCGDQTNNTTAAVLINTTGAASRANQIVGNLFRANSNDILLNGNGGVYSTNTGVLDTYITGNLSDRAYRHFLYATDAQYIACTGNKIGLANQINASLPAIDLNGTCDHAYISSNTVSYQSFTTGPTYGLSLGATTTNTAIGENDFQGSVAPIQFNTGATWTSTLSVAGTWTPSVGGTATYTIQSGYYLKIGQLVYIQAKLIINVIGTGSTSNISGLPFPVFNDANASQGSGSVSYFSGLASSVVNIVPVALNNTSTMQFDTLAAAATSMTAAAAIMTSGTRLDFSLVYKSAT